MTSISTRAYLVVATAQVAMGVTGVSGALVRWHVAAGGNGHAYEGVVASTTWSQANAAAGARGGHLATIQNAAENQFVFGLINSPSYWKDFGDTRYNWGPWLGGRQPAGTAEPNAGWEWVTGEPFTYTNWHTGEPNNQTAFGEEDFLEYFSAPSGNRGATWNDFINTTIYPLNGYVVEYDARPNLESFVDFVTYGPTISGVFAPPPDMSILDAASLSGYDHFNWFQVVVGDPHPPDGRSVPYVDPPSGGGSAFGGFADSQPFYWDEQGTSGTGYHLSDNLYPANAPIAERTVLRYQGTPTEPSLVGSETLDFVTCLAGVYADGSWDGIGAVTWSTDFNGASGGVTGISKRRNVEEPGNGTGGAIITSYNVNLESLPLIVRQLMVANGARNVAVPEPYTIVIVALVVAILFPVSRFAPRRG